MLSRPFSMSLPIAVLLALTAGCVQPDSTAQNAPHVVAFRDTLDLSTLDPERHALVERKREEGLEPNRLIFEQSPYLIQHAFNPVDWYPWGEEAFAKARAEDKPIFLSVGYSTCYWCHVMEREVFEVDSPRCPPQ